MTCTTLYRVTGKETTESDNNKKGKQIQNTIDILLVKCVIEFFFLLFFFKYKESLLIDKNVVPDMTFVVNVFAKFLMYLLASEMRQYFGSRNDNNLSTILNEIKKMFLMETFVI